MGEAIEVTVYNPEYDRTGALAPGDELEFGRYTRGVGQLREETLVSRRHGLITATEDGFSVTSTGSYLGFTVSDRTTPSKLYIPVAVGPIPIPFADASITFDRDIEGELQVTVSGSPTADRWRCQWGPEAENPRRNRPRAGATTGMPLTRRPVAARMRLRNGRPYAWRSTLVAMCAPILTGESASVPTNTVLAKRLGYTVKQIERHVQQIYKALDIPPSGRRRDLAVQDAITRGIITHDDL